MRWKLVINIDENKSDDMYYDTREMMRNAKKFYQTMCDPPVLSVQSFDLNNSR